MTRTETKRSFEGPFKKQLSELAGLIDWLEIEHDKSYVKAGDNRVYAFGGDGFILVLDESVWEGQIELITPKGSLAIKPGEDGKINVSPATEGDANVKELLKDGVNGIRTYYENRYWSTPKTATENSQPA